MKKKSTSKSRKRKTSRKTGEPLGHGDHWQALGFEGDDLIRLLEEIAQAASQVENLNPPWPGAKMEKLVQMELPWKEISLSLLLGKPPKEESLHVLSAFPILSRTSAWKLKIDGVSDSYGPFEGVVNATADTGHPLQWFDPHFARNAAAWRAGGTVDVNLAGLALSMRRFDAEPYILHEGPRVEELRARLKAEGRHQEAADPQLSVTYGTETLRTIFSSFHDHHEFVGKVLRVAQTGLGSMVKGWRVELECRHDDHGTGRSLPVYVFPPALEAGYLPKKGDLVSGLLWLQGSYPCHV